WRSARSCPMRERWPRGTPRTAGSECVRTCQNLLDWVSASGDRGWSPRSRLPDEPVLDHWSGCRPPFQRRPTTDLPDVCHSAGPAYWNTRSGWSPWYLLGLSTLNVTCVPG